MEEEQRSSKEEEDHHYTAQASPEEDRGGDETEEVQSLLRTVQVCSRSGEEQFVYISYLSTFLFLRDSKTIKSELVQGTGLKLTISSESFQTLPHF